MRGFDTDLSARWVTATTCATNDPLSWTGSRGDTFTVPAGFVTDLATSPRVLHWYVLPYGPYTRAAVLHDWLLKLIADWARRHLGNVVIAPMDGSDDQPPVTSRDADGIFRAAMHDLGVPWRKRWTMWAAVRIGALFNPDRAYGREFARDLPAIIGVGLLNLHVVFGVVGVSISLGLDRIIGLFAGRPQPQRIAGRTGERPRGLTMTDNGTDGRKHLFRDSKLGLWVTGVATVAFDGALDGVINGLTDVDTSGWSGWWTTVASAVLATGLGALTAYRAKRHKRPV